VLHGVALLNHNEREHVLEFCIQNVLCCLPKTSLYFPSPISRSTSSFVDTTMEGILSSFISSICFNICTFLFLLLLHRVDISDFRQIKAGQQNCNNFLFRLKKINSSLYLLIFEQRNTEIALNRILF